MDSPPQAQSMTFNERGECTQLTIGYVMDKNIGNTGGLGGVFGIFYALGGARWGDTHLAPCGYSRLRTWPGYMMPPILATTSSTIRHRPCPPCRPPRHSHRPPRHSHLPPRHAPHPPRNAISFRDISSQHVSVPTTRLRPPVSRGAALGDERAVLGRGLHSHSLTSQLNLRISGTHRSR